MMEQLKQLTAAIWGAARQRKFPLETETAWFVLASALDFGVTFIMLHHPEVRFVESNPVALFFIHHWGIKGLFLFKLAIVTLVVVICQIVARHNLKLARGVLVGGTAVVAGVVVYSVLLHQTATQGALSPF